MSLRVRRPLSRAPRRIGRIVALAASFAVAAPAVAQSAPKITAADYDRAVRFLRPNVDPLVIGGDVTAHWLPDGRFWYRN